MGTYKKTDLDDRFFCVIGVVRNERWMTNDAC